VYQAASEWFDWNQEADRPSKSGASALQEITSSLRLAIESAHELCVTGAAEGIVSVRTSKGGKCELSYHGSLG